MNILRNFICALLCSVIFLGVAGSVFAEEEYIQEEEEIIEEEEILEEEIIDDFYYEDLYEDYQAESSQDTGAVKIGNIHTEKDLEALIEQERTFPLYDTTGMTDIEILLENMRRYYNTVVTDSTALYTVKYEALPHYVGGGRFNDEGLDYESMRGKVNLSMSRTARYMQCLAKAYYVEGSEYYHSPEIKKIMMECFEDIIDRFYGVFGWDNETKTEFWGYTVSMYTRLAPSVMIFLDEIPEEMMPKIIRCMLWMPEEIVAQWNTGTNAVWYAQQAIVRGALEQNEYWVNVGINRLNELTMINSLSMVESTHNDAINTTLEGHQSDGTYHMHGATLYMSYALSSLQDTVLFASLFDGTKYSFDGVENSLDFALNGALWSARGTEMEPQGYGRLIGNQSTLTSSGTLRTALSRLYYLYPERQEEIKTAIRSLLSEKDGMYLPLDGTRYFPRSEVLAHQRENYSLWIRTTSRRVVGMEFNGKISVDAYWGHTGVTGIYDGKEHNLMVTNPFFDYKLYPGVTNPRTVHIYKNAAMTEGIHQTYAGGVSDGDFGSISFKMTEKMGTSAYKSYFMFDEGYIALGTGIRSSNWAEVNTTVEQRFLYGDVEIDGEAVAKGEKTYKDVNTVYHSGTGYIFPEKETVGLRNKTVVASQLDHRREYDTSTQKQRADMFALWINHGTRPSNGDYVYSTLMNTTPEKIAEYNKNYPIVVAANNKKQQGVWHKTANIAYATFYEGGEVKFHNGLSLKADVPCMVMIREVDGKLKVCVSNPYSHQVDVKITVTAEDKANEMTFELPGLDENTVDYGGSTVTQFIE